MIRMVIRMVIRLVRQKRFDDLIRVREPGPDGEGYWRYWGEKEVAIP